jgi:thymidylate synthase
MKTYRGKGLGDMYLALVREITRNGKEIPTRHGPCLELPEPVCLQYEEPGHCWMVIPGRGFNPFFALAEVMWILSGNGNVEWISYFNSNMRKFADEGQEDFHGAYGLRIRKWPVSIANYIHLDQLEYVIKKLREDPYSRQAVVSLWDPERDNIQKSKDYPCNNLIYYQLRDGILHQTVVQRSCDLIWGAPHNAVQFSHIHAYVAGCLGAKIGKLTYFVQNLHYYLELYKPTLAKLIELAFDENEQTYQATVKALAVPHFVPISGKGFKLANSGVNQLMRLASDKLVRFCHGETWGFSADTYYWQKTIPEMLWIYRLVKESQFEMRLGICVYIRLLPEPLRELVLMYYEDKTYGISKEVYSTCVRMLDEEKEKDRASKEGKEGSENAATQASDALPASKPPIPSKGDEDSQPG